MTSRYGLAEPLSTDHAPLSKLKTRSVTDFDRAVGARLKARRQALGLNQTAVADAMGVSQVQVVNYETGVTRMSAARLQKAATALSVSAGYLLDGDDTLPDTKAVKTFLSLANAERIMRAYSTIKDERRRKLAVEVIESIAGDRD